MIRFYALKYSTIFSISLAALHLTTYCYYTAYNYARRQIGQAQQAAIELAAARLGYEPKPDPVRILDPLDLATLEALREEINPSLVRALLKVESNKKQYAMSDKGALGLMQVMPFNAKACGLEVAQLLIPEHNIRCGVKILKQNLIAYNYNTDYAIQGYNGGRRCINKCPESIQHSKRVLTELAKDIS